MIDKKEIKKRYGKFMDLYSNILKTHKPDNDEYYSDADNIEACEVFAHMIKEFKSDEMMYNIIKEYNETIEYVIDIILKYCINKLIERNEELKNKIYPPECVYSSYEDIEDYKYDIELFVEICEWIYIGSKAQEQDEIKERAEIFEKYNEYLFDCDGIDWYVGDIMRNAIYTAANAIRDIIDSIMTD